MILFQLASKRVWTNDRFVNTRLGLQYRSGIQTPKLFCRLRLATFNFAGYTSLLPTGDRSGVVVYNLNSKECGACAYSMRFHIAANATIHQEMAAETGEAAHMPVGEVAA